jgi:dTDP-4-amino-4,6-dideoxygalactose transaminase
MPEIMELARNRGLVVIEDCAQAHGARIGGVSVGSFADVGAWSFCQDKIMTTGGEGGMVTTRDRALWREMWEYKDHGKNLQKMNRAPEEAGFRWLHDSFGTNWRMLEMQAALGLLQLERMPEWHLRRAAIAGVYAAALGQFADLVRVPMPRPDVQHAWYRFYAYVRPEALKEGWSRDRIIAEANSAGVPLLQGSCPEIYLEESVQRAGFAPAQRLPNAAQLGETSLCLLTHPTISDEQVEQAAEILAGVLQKARR